MASNDKVQGKSRSVRLLSTETFLFCVGLGCLFYGFTNAMSPMPIFFGLCIVLGMIALHFVRKRDWDAHWAEQEMVRKAHEARMAEEKERER